MSWAADVRQDLRFAQRLMTRTPAFSANVIGTTALGIALCSTTFSVVSGMLLAPLPFAHADRIAVLYLRAGDKITGALPPAEYFGVARSTHVIAAIGASEPASATMMVNGQPQDVSTELVTPSFLRVFAVSPYLGRAFADDEGSDSPVLMLSYEAWRTRFNADSGIIGRRLQLDGVAQTVIAVMRPRFRAHFVRDPFAWRPMSVRLGDARVYAVVRLADGVRREQGEAWLATVIHARIAGATPFDSIAAKPILEPVSDSIYGSVRRPLLVLLGAVLFVLALVAANVATMFLARSSARAEELDVRAALGASTGRQVRQLITESLFLTTIGGALGVLASYWLVGIIGPLGAYALRRMDSVAVDWHVLAFAAASVATLAIVAGTIPRWVARNRPNVLAGASSTRVARTRTSSALVVAQVAFAVVLLVGAGLLVKGFFRVLPSHPGFATENRATLLVFLDSTYDLRKDPDAANRFALRTIDQMRRIRGVRDAAANIFLPLTGTVWTTWVRLPGTDQPVNAFYNAITSAYFDVMDIKVLRGRAITPRDDRASERVAVVNDVAAATWWPEENPIGRTVAILGSTDTVSATVVGVVNGTRFTGRRTTIPKEIYVPLAQASTRYVSFVVHTSMHPAVVTQLLRGALWSVDPRLPIQTSDLATVAGESVAVPKFFALAFGIFAAASLVLTAFAIYGVLAFSVSQRRREIGIRIALGAPARRIAATVLGRALAMSAGGVIIGLFLALMLTRYMESILMEVRATDGTVFGATLAAALIVAVAAACAPAYQAVRVDPMSSLRAD